VFVREPHDRKLSRVVRRAGHS